MKPASPVIPDTVMIVSERYREVVFAKDQPEYNPLPALLEEDGTVHTRWRLSLKERLQVLFSGDIYLALLTFNQPLQPVRLSAKPTLDQEH
jgi:hypothetical protein